MSGFPGRSARDRRETRGVRVFHARPPGADHRSGSGWGPGWGPAARLRCAWRLALSLRSRLEPGDPVVRWPDPGPVPVIRADDGEGIRAARLALAITGAPARLVGVWTRAAPPWDPRPWNRCDVVVAAGPHAARALREAGVDVRRIRLLERGERGERGGSEAAAAGTARADVDADALAPLLERVARAPGVLVRRVDWALR